MFDTEPTTESPLFELPEVVVTPHLGASTHEAQDKAGDTIAEQVGLALAGEFVPFAVNVSAAEAQRDRAARSCRSPSGSARSSPALAGSVPSTLEIEYEGQIADYDTRILTLSVLKGFFGRRQRRAGVVRERPADGRGARHRGHARPTTHHVARLRQPHHRPRRRPHAGRHPRRPATASPASCMVDDHTRRRAAGRATCWWSATTTAPA